MGFNSYKFLVVLLSWAFLASSSHQLGAYETQVLLQLRKHLEYPMPLDIWQDFDGDLCNLNPTAQMAISCVGNSITELKIMGDKLPGKVRGPTQTLSAGFSMDSFVTTLTRLVNLRVLSLVSLGMWGPLPDKIHRLNNLEVLDMSSNFMYGVVPSQMSRMVRIHTMIFDGNLFNETVPDWLGSLSNLTVLSFKNNRLKGQFPVSLSRISTLTDVVLSRNAISGELPDLSALSSLHLLDLRENFLDSELPALPSGLATLLLSNNSLSGSIPRQFEDLKQLQHLDLSKNVLTGTPPIQLFSLPNVSYLNLASNMLSGSLPEKLSCGEALGFVDISNNRLVGSLPSCLDSTSGKRIVKYDMNCLSIDAKNQHSQLFCQQSAALMQRKGSKGKGIALLVGIIVGITIAVVILAAGIFIFWRKMRSRGDGSSHTAPKVMLDNTPHVVSSELLANARIISLAAKYGGQGNNSYRLFSMEELSEATNDFDQSMLLGEGSIGKIYKGKLENGSLVAIRSLALHKKFLIRNLNIRLDLLSKLRHPHLVSLLGHCIDGGMQDDAAVNRVFLVYEFVPGNFHAHLSETSPEKVLKWSDRLSILIGVAKAVHFLHTGVIPPSTSNRLKTRNILLDEYHIAKLSDYGMSIIAEDVEKSETKGDSSKPWNSNKLDDDVYNFGFILLESLAGPVARGKGEAYLLNEMTSFGSQDGRRKIVDPIVLMTSSQESLSIVVSITNKCISSVESSRPSFEDVLWNLQYAAQVQATADADRKSDAPSVS